METLYTNKALRVLAKPVMDLDKITAAPSPSPNRWSDKVPSREMTVEEIKEFITAFGKTAKLLKDAGVDGVEIHAVHEGYLLDQFTLKYVNKRNCERNQEGLWKRLSGIVTVQCGIEDQGLPRGSIAG